MHLAFRYRLYPTAGQRVVIAKHFGCARFAYNHALALRIAAYTSEKKTLSQFDLCKVFPKLRKEEATAWLSEVCSHALQCEMANLDAAYTRFFREKKGFPKFKSKHNDKKSYSTNVNITVGPDFIKLPKIGRISAAISRPIAGRIMKATVSQTPTGKYFVSVLCDSPGEHPQKMATTETGTIGIDLGLSHFLTTSQGEKVENPRHLKNALRKLRRAQRRLSARKKGGSNRERQRKVVARIHEKVANRRSDFQHKLSTRLVRENQTDTIALETLSVAGMQKNSRLARSISDAGWAQFVSMLEYKAEREGKNILRIGRFEPSSKMCSCGELNHTLTLSDRRWTCGTCGVTHDRDVLAARNIKRMALHPKNQSLGQEVPEYTLGEVLA